MDVNSFLKAFKSSRDNVPVNATAINAANNEGTEPQADGEVSFDDSVDEDSDTHQEDDYEGGHAPQLSRRNVDRYRVHDVKPNQREFEELRVFSTNDRSASNSHRLNGRSALPASLSAEQSWKRGMAMRMPGGAREGLKRLRSSSADAYWKELLAEKSKLDAVAHSESNTDNKVVTVDSGRIAAQLETAMVDVDDLLGENTSASLFPQHASPTEPRSLATLATSVEAVDSRDLSPDNADSGEAPGPHAREIGSLTKEAAVPQPDEPQQRTDAPKKMSMLERAKALNSRK